MFSDSLEDEILHILWEKGHALTGAEIKALLPKHRCPPITLLFKVLNALERANLLVQESGVGWGTRYYPRLSKKEFYNQSSESLAIACLVSGGAYLKVRCHLDILRQITELVFRKKR